MEKVVLKILASQTLFILHEAIILAWFVIVIHNLLVIWYSIHEKMAGDEMMDFEKVTM